MFDALLSLCVRLACAAVALGWGLSAIGKLDGWGYSVGGAVILFAVGMISRPQLKALRVSGIARSVKCRLRRAHALPVIYLLTLALILAGSVLYEPNNFDGLNYREPKVLYWLDAHRWQWVNTPYAVVNYTLPNYEWLTVPLFLATGGFHAAVIINWIAFLFLPSLIFCLLRVFGSSARLAYDWMWVMPSGYLIALQAGGLGNDLPGLTAILAGLYFANRFVATANPACLLDALLAAGFCSGVKLSNLGLPVFVAIILLKAPGMLRANRRTLVPAVVVATVVSALIPLALNFAHSGTILGTTARWDRITNPAAGCLANVLMTLLAALAPPVFPWGHHLGFMLEHALGNGIASWLHANYVKFTLDVNELAQEEAGGLGLGITVALLLTVALALGNWRARKAPSRAPDLLPWQQLAWWSWLGLALLILSATLGTGAAFPRNLLPWFPMVLLPLVGAFGCGQIARCRIWRVCAPLVSLSVLPAILCTPSRPLVPPQMMIRLAHSAGASEASLARIEAVYAVYASRADPFADLTRGLPVGERTLGLVTDGAEPTASWWKPYGSHRCVYLLSDAQTDAARNGGVQYVVLQELGCQRYFNTNAAGWLAVHHARAVKTIEVRLFPGYPPFPYTLARLDTATSTQGGQPR
jgi:hypothetical protein